MKQFRLLFAFAGSLLLCAGLALADGPSDPSTPPADPSAAPASPAPADPQAAPADSPSAPKEETKPADPQTPPKDETATPDVKTPTPPTKTSSRSAKSGAPKTHSATTKAPVVIGSSTCFLIRECVAGQTPQQRADHILDVFNKYLGGKSSSFSVKPAGKNVVILMNKDQLINVTPQDAKSAKARNAVQLATAWKASLAKAFNETKAMK